MSRNACPCLASWHVDDPASLVRAGALANPDGQITYGMLPRLQHAAFLAAARKIDGFNKIKHPLKPMRGLVMGRFQPFHLGHLDLVKQVLSECDEVVIAVTSAQFNYLEKDPFTAGERVEMIHASLKDAGVDLSRCFILGIENQFNVATWASYIKAALPSFDKAYSGNDYVSMLLADSSIGVARPNFLDRSKYNATDIRLKILSGGPWEEMVPGPVAKIIHRIGGKNRLAVISKSDTIPTEH